MNWLDIAILMVVVLSGFFGWRTGIVRGGVLIGGIILGIFLAGHLGGPLGENLVSVSNETTARLGGFLTVFVIVLAFAWILGILARNFLKTVFLGWIDSIGGAVFGVAASTLVITALIVAVGSSTLPSANNSIRDSRLAKFLADNAPLTMGLLPEEYRDVLGWVGEVTPPGVQVKEVKTEVLAPGLVSIATILIIDNPNPFGGKLQQVRYGAQWKGTEDWRLLGEGEQSSLRIRASSADEVQLLLRVKQADWPAVSAFQDDLVAKGSVQLQVKGVVTLAFPAETVEVSFESAPTPTTGQ